MNLEQMKKELLCDEGLRLKPYVDSVGKLSIGVGHNLADNGITQEVAELLLTQDIQAAADSLSSRFPWWKDKPENVQRVLLNMCFNMGIGTLSTFTTTLRLIQSDKFQEASVSMLQSKWAKQVGQRAIRLSEQLKA